MSLNATSARSTAHTKFGAALALPLAQRPLHNYVAEMTDGVSEFLKEQRDKAKTPEAKTELASHINSRTDMIKAVPPDVIVRQGRYLLQGAYGAQPVAAVEEFLQGHPQKAIDQAREHGPRLFRIANTVKQEYGHRPEVFRLALSAQGQLMNLFNTLTMASKKATEHGPVYVAEASQAIKKTTPQLEKHLQTEAGKASAADKPVIESQIKFVKALSEKSSQVLDALGKHLWQKPHVQSDKPSTVFFKATFTPTPQ